jgi:hypothetical protein
MAKHSKHGGKEDHLKSFLMSLYRDLRKGFDNPDPRWIAEKNTRVAALEARIHPLVIGYLGQWKEQMDTAITDGKLPEEKGRFYWFMALAGNLLWAATCFIPLGAAVSGTSVLGLLREESAAKEALRAGTLMKPFTPPNLPVETSATAQRVIQVMSVGGAVFGSGFGEQFMGGGGNTPRSITLKLGETTEDIPLTGDPAADGKLIARLVLDFKEGELEQVYKKRERQWALEIDALAQWGDDVKEVLDSYLWTHMFPRIPYDQWKLGRIHLLALNKINGALQDYNRQWKDWQFRTERSKPKWKNVHMRGDVWDYSVPDPGAFQPKLNFDLLV